MAKQRAVDKANSYPYHLYWQRVTINGDPYLVGGAKVIGEGPTGYMLKSLAPERDDLNSLAWSLGIATALALIGAMLLAQAAATTVLRPVRRLGEAARRLGEGKLDTRLQVSGTDELAELSRTFNGAAESLEHRVAELSAREASSRRFVADMSHELRTPMTAISAVTEVLEEEQDNLDPMIAPAVQLVVSETRRLNDLVENLMEVTRFDAGTAKLVLDDVDVADQVTACIDARAWLDAVELDADRGIMARLDPRRLDVILANLIGNALKHGGSPVRVSVRTEKPAAGTAGRPGHRGRRPGARHPRGRPAARLRPLLQGQRLPAALRGQRPGPVHRAGERPHPRRRDHRAQRHGPEGGAVFTLRLPRDSRRVAEEREAATSPRAPRRARLPHDEDEPASTSTGTAARTWAGTAEAAMSRDGGDGAPAPRPTGPRVRGAGPGQRLPPQRLRHPRHLRTRRRGRGALAGGLCAAGRARDARRAATVSAVVRVYLVCGSRVAPVEREVRMPGGRSSAERLPVARGAAGGAEAPAARQEESAGFETAVPRRSDDQRAGATTTRRRRCG